MSILSEITSMQDSSFEEQLDYIHEYELQQPYDSMVYLAKAVVYFFSNKLEEAEIEIKEAIQHMPSRYINHMYYANIAFAQKKYFVAAKECLIAWNFATQFGMSENWENIQTQLNETISASIKEMTDDELKDFVMLRRILETPGSFFPLLKNEKLDGWSLYVNNFIDYDSEKEFNHFVGVAGISYYDSITYGYMQMYKLANQYNNYAKYPTESWYGKLTKEEKFDGKMCIVPIAGEKYGQEIEFVSEKCQKQIIAYPGRFHYYRIDKPVTIKSDVDYIMGKPVLMGHNPNRKKLVLMVFTDALSQKDLTETNFENMPNTKEFFGEGTIFKNCYSTGEWTHPSFASIFTGLYTTNHHVIYRSSAYSFPKNIKTISEVFQDAGYFTANISSSVGVSPYLGGMRGFDRVVNKSCMGFSDGEIISDAIDHMEAFKETDQFVMLSLFEHHYHSEDTMEGVISHNIVQQTAVSFDNSLDKLDSKQKSVRKQYHFSSTDRYRVGQRQADRRLKQIYDYVINNYKEDEFVICLISDHGVSFLEDREEMLKDSVTNSVLMMRGSGIPKTITEEYINHIDYFSALQKYTNLNYEKTNNNCCLPKIFGGEGRSYTYTESIYNGQTYKAVIHDSGYDYFFETIALTHEDGGIDLSEGYSMKVYERGSNKEIESRELYEKMENIVYDHIKRNVIY